MRFFNTHAHFKPHWESVAFRQCVDCLLITHSFVHKNMTASVSKFDLIQVRYDAIIVYDVRARDQFNGSLTKASRML